MYLEFDYINNDEYTVTTPCTIFKNMILRYHYEQ